MCKYETWVAWWVEGQQTHQREGATGRIPQDMLPEMPQRQEIDQTVQNFLKHWKQRRAANFRLKVTSLCLKNLGAVNSEQVGKFPAKKFVLWPHDLCYVGIDSKRVMHDDLSPLQWMCGFTRSIIKNPSEQAWLNMLKLGSDFFQNALDLGRAVARGAYKVVLTEMEAGLVDWENLEAVQSLRRQYAQRCIHKPAQNGPASGPPNGPFKSGNSKNGENKQHKTMPCPSYQTVSCTSSNDHTHGSVHYRHICAYCWAVLYKSFPHPEAECKTMKGKPVPHAKNLLSPVKPYYNTFFYDTCVFKANCVYIRLKSLSKVCVEGCGQTCNYGKTGKMYVENRL